MTEMITLVTMFSLMAIEKETATSGGHVFVGYHQHQEKLQCCKGLSMNNAVIMMEY